MRILLVVHQFFPEFRSGTETLTRRTAEELKRRGHTVCILTATPYQPSRPVWTREQWEGLDIIRFSPNPVSSPLCGGVEQSYLRPEFESDFALLLKELKPDLMHVFHLRRHTLSLVRAAVRCSVPMVASLTDYWLACPTGQMQFPAAVACDGPRIDGANCAQHLAAKFSPPLGAIPEWIWCWFLPLLTILPLGPFSALQRRPAAMASALADFKKVLVPSELMWRTFQHQGFDTQHFEVCPFGISLEGLNNIPPRQPWQGDLHRPLRVGFIGNITHAKGCHVLLDALAIVEEHDALEVMIYGNPQDDPRYWMRLQNQAQDLPHVRWCGVFGSADVFSVLSSLDVLVVPSLWRENSPLIVLQALASGLPLLVSDVDGMPKQVISGVNACLFPPGDSRALASQLCYWLKKPGDLAALANRGGQPRTIADYGDQLEQIYARFHRS